MFAMQHYIEAMHDPGRKRSREDDDGFAGFSEHRHVSTSRPLTDSPGLTMRTETTSVPPTSLVAQAQPAMASEFGYHAAAQ